MLMQLIVLVVSWASLGFGEGMFGVKTFSSRVHDSCDVFGCYI